MTYKYNIHPSIHQWIQSLVYSSHMHHVKNDDMDFLSLKNMVLQSYFITMELAWRKVSIRQAACESAGFNKFNLRSLSVEEKLMRLCSCDGHILSMVIYDYVDLEFNPKNHVRNNPEVNIIYLYACVLCEGWTTKHEYDFKPGKAETIVSWKINL